MSKPEPVLVEHGRPDETPGRFLRLLAEDRQRTACTESAHSRRGQSNNDRDAARLRSRGKAVPPPLPRLLVAERSTRPHVTARGSVERRPWRGRLPLGATHRTPGRGAVKATIAASGLALRARPSRRRSLCHENSRGGHQSQPSSGLVFDRRGWPSFRPALTSCPGGARRDGRVGADTVTAPLVGRRPGRRRPRDRDRGEEVGETGNGRDPG